MKILAHFHGYPPQHNAGAEWMAHHMFLWLQKRGHQILVAAGDEPKHKEFEGITLVPEYRSVHIRNRYQWADIVVSHLDRTGKAINNCKATDRPALFLMHNTHHNTMIDLIAHRSILCFNSKYTNSVPHYAHKESCIVYPPCPVDYYKTNRGGARFVTLVNHAVKKGSGIFHEMARRLPDIDFMGVRGGYFYQDKEKMKNVTYKENTPNINKQYALTKVILMPSHYESFGRVAIEAAASGIPTIAAPTPGLKEALGKNGIFIPVDDPDSWEKEISKLMTDKDYYSERSNQAKARAVELEGMMEKQMIELESLMIKAINRKTKEGRKQ